MVEAVAGGKGEPHRRLVAVQEVRREMARGIRRGCRARHRGSGVHQLGNSLNRQDCQSARNEVSWRWEDHHKAEGRSIAEWLRSEAMVPSNNC